MQMLAAGIKAPLLLEELENHLREDVAHQMRSGLTAQQAFEAGVLKIGQSRALKREFARVGGTRESRLRKLVMAAAVMNIFFGTLWIIRGVALLVHLRFLWTHGWTPSNPSDIWLISFDYGINFYGAACGIMAIVAARRVFKWQHSGITLMSACALQTIIGVFVDCIWRASYFGFDLRSAIAVSVFLSYPILLYALCKNSELKSQYV